LYPRGGLLGGSSKPSKLAALAAARKKKAEEDKKANTPPVAQSDAESKQLDRTVALLDRLKVRGKENEPTSTAAAGSDNGGVALQSQDRNRAYPIRPKQDTRSASPPKEEVSDNPKENEPKAPIKPLQDLRATPSIFAKTLVGTQARRSSATSISAPRPQEDSMFALPFADHLSDTKSDPFAGPSPDDVVLNAQAKGLKRG